MQPLPATRAQALPTERAVVLHSALGVTIGVALR
jgi:hypothetical protein